MVVLSERVKMCNKNVLLDVQGSFRGRVYELRVCT